MNRIRKMIKEILGKGEYYVNMLLSRLYIARNGHIEDIIYGNKRLKLFYSEYNCGMNCKLRLTERALELAVARDWGNQLNGDYIEIGAVTPYYGSNFSNHLVIDPYDSHENVNIKKSLFEYDYFGKNVLSISTIEHVGTGDYGLDKTESCIEALNKILEESSLCLISFPMGYNNILDKYVMEDNRFRGLTTNVIRVCVYGRNKYGNDWEILDKPEKNYYKYSYGPLWANCVCFIEKSIGL